MIQRIQSLYLFVAMVLYALLFVLPYALLPGVSSEVFVFGVVQTVDGVSAVELPFWPLAVVCGLLPLATGINIFLYRKRTMQMRICLNSMVVMAMTVALMWYNVSQFGSENMVYQLPSVFPALAIIFSFLAYHGIRKDDQLVKASDRLR